MAAFVDRIRGRFRIGSAELAFVEELQSRPMRVPRGHVLATAGEPIDNAFVLLTGWAMSYSRFADGLNQVRRLHFPGDLLAMPSIAMRHHAEDIQTVSNAVVSPFPKAALARLFEMPRLAAMMYMIAQAERITAGDRMANLGRNSARGRIAFLLMDILHRLRAVDHTVHSTFYMHLTREQIAQFAGMTPVHASRMWSLLIDDGLITCEGRMVTIVDEQALAKLSNYRERDSDFDHDWLKLVQAPVREPNLAT